MNKLIIDKDNVVTIINNVLNIEILVSELVLNISGKVLINDIKENNEQLKLIINLAPNSELIYNKFSSCSKINNLIIANLEEKSTLIFNYSIICKDTSTLEFNSNLKGNNNNCEINIKTVTEEKGNIKIQATGSVKENINNNNLLENIRILTLNDSENTIIPNLLVNSDNVIVNHNATISSVNDDYLFYLTSKGIEEKNAIILIKKGYLLNNLQIDKTIKETIDNLI